MSGIFKSSVCLDHMITIYKKKKVKFKNSTFLVNDLFKDEYAE
jgi:hypothetical protein